MNDHIHAVSAHGAFSIPEEHEAWKETGEPCIFCGKIAARTEYRIHIQQADGSVDVIHGATRLSADETEALVKSVPIDVILLEVRQASN